MPNFGLILNAVSSLTMSKDAQLQAIQNLERAEILYLCQYSLYKIDKFNLIII
jgi:hypothetical protein